jgi:hypothetical protein
MIDIDGYALVLGLFVGAAVSALFFAGLAYGMRVAFGTDRPAVVLLVSAGLRIALLLAAGWFVAKTGAWALGGFAVSFLLVRFVAISFARIQPNKEGSDGTNS